MKKNFQDILSVLKSGYTPVERRDWLVSRVSGLGMKAASHFLRNLGETDLAIIDVHVLKYLGEKHIRSKKHYLDLENKFRGRAKALGLSVAELDALVWKRFSGTKWEEFVR